MNALHFKTLFILFQIEQLTGHLREKADQCSELLLCREQLLRDVQDRDAEIEKLQRRRQELEHALLVSAESTAEVRGPR